MKMKKLLFLFIGCLVANSSVNAMEPNIFRATESGDAGLVRAKLSSGADPNQADNGFPLLQIAACHERPEVLQVLIEYRANVNMLGLCGHTPLLDACARHSPEALRCVQALLAAHADVNLAVTAEHCVPLAGAARSGSPGVVQALLGAGANPNHLDSLGMNPLHWACDYNVIRTAEDRQAIVQMLVDAGAHVNEQAANNYNITPLHLAAYWSPLQTVRVLLVAGADVNLKDGEGKTPLDWAKARPEVFNLIKRVKDNSCIANVQILALLEAGHSRLGAESPAQSAFHAQSEVARLIACFICKWAFEDALDEHNQ